MGVGAQEPDSRDETDSELGGTSVTEPVKETKLKFCPGRAG